MENDPRAMLDMLNETTGRELALRRALYAANDRIAALTAENGELRERLVGVVVDEVEGSLAAEPVIVAPPALNGRTRRHAN